MVSDSTTRPTFKDAVLKVIHFLERDKFDYVILGGVAVGVVGEPRFTADLDLNLFISKKEVPGFLKKAKTASFQVDEREATGRAERFGSFRFSCHDIRVDVILASTELEREAFQRKQKIAFFGKEMFFPSPEDLILLKLIPGRHKDLADAESIALRHKGKLDLAYLEKWAERVCEEAEDFRVMRELKKLLAL